MFITLKPSDQRDVTADQVIRRLSTALDQVQGMKVYMQAAQDITIGAVVSKTQYQFTMTDIDLSELDLYGPKLLDALQKLPELTAVASDQQSSARMLNVVVDRTAAARLGIDPAAVDNTLYDAFGQRHVARIYLPLNYYYVILEVDPHYQLGPNALQRIYVRSQDNTSVPLSQIARIETGTMPAVVNHQGQFPSVTLSFNLAPGRDHRGRRRGGAEGGGRPAHAVLRGHRVPGQRPSVPDVARLDAAPDPGGPVRGLRDPGRALRKHDPPADHPVDAASAGLAHSRR